MNDTKFFTYWKHFVTKEAREGSGYLQMYATPKGMVNRYFLQGIIMSVENETFQFQTKRGTYTVPYENILDAKAF